MKTKKNLAILVLALVGLAVFLQAVFAGGPLEPTAPPGPVFKTLDEVEPRVPIHAADLPLTITEPNSYYLVEDVNFTDDANHAITIECNDVTIDLMGYTLKGPDSGATSGLYMSGRSNVEVRNGTVRDFYYGIHEESTAGRQHRITNVRAMSNACYGIRLRGEGHLVKDCTAADNDFYGIYAGAGSTVTGNTGYSNGDYGIYTDSGCTVTGNTCYYNGGDGLVTGTGCTITGNTSRLNTGDGIHFLGLGTIADNTADRNSGYGIRVTSGAVVARNSCAENTLDGIKAGDANRIVQNDCVGNGFGDDGAGIHVTSLRNIILDNTVSQNDRGIDVDSTRNFIAKNTATTNTVDYDIAGNNSYGPIVNVGSVGDISLTANADHPWANFQY